MPKKQNQLKDTFEQDRQLFLSALERMNAVVKDDSSGEKEKRPSSPRRKKLLRQGKIIPEAQIDLHGLSREEAIHKARHFLENARYRGDKAALIITGRGNNSDGMPVLRNAIERSLARDVKHLIDGWEKAPPRFGGEGAVVVFLKSLKGNG